MVFTQFSLEYKVLDICSYNYYTNNWLAQCEHIVSLIFNYEWIYQSLRDRIITGKIAA